MHQSRSRQRQESGSKHHNAERGNPRQSTDKWRHQQHPGAQSFNFSTHAHQFAANPQRCVTLMILQRVPDLVSSNGNGS